MVRKLGTDSLYPKDSAAQGGRSTWGRGGKKTTSSRGTIEEQSRPYLGYLA
jgi:hypothetical protein